MQQISRIQAYINLVRLPQPIGIFLLFWPCSWGVALSSAQIKWHLIILFFIGSFIMRAAGCIINDISDRQLDSKVERTKNRPLASGKIKLWEALLILAFLLLIGLYILLKLPIISIKIGLLSSLLIIIYPLMKRITYFPQLVLGITYNLGILIAYSAIENHLSLSAILTYIGAIFWTLGYDTIYGFQDIEDDKKIGVKSTAIKFENKAKIFLIISYSIFITFLLTALTQIPMSISIISIIFITLLIFQLLWQILTLDTRNPKNCLTRFKSNAFVGGIVFIIIALAK
jgi:4-hydroxybenzoate polyprenyl transferase